MQRVRRINLQLDALGQPGWRGDDEGLLDTADDLLRNYRQLRRVLRGDRCPADRRIEDFLDVYLTHIDVAARLRLPADGFVLDRVGLALEMSLPADGDCFRSPWLASYRVRQGVLHNPGKDRRTTAGVLQVVEGGLPIPWDEKAVPAATFAALFQAAMRPPDALLKLPFTVGQEAGAHLWVSLLLRPLVSPAVPGLMPEKRMETRFYAPGGLVANLDFVERIFGNAGDPYLPENDAGLDVAHWSGYTGCVILAPHLIKLTKKEVGLPHWDAASERQRRDSMCWKDEHERYNDGGAFKIMCRDLSGVIVTLIADNDFDYSKKEIKSQIGYAANLFGRSEEEHSGGALAFPSFNLGDSYSLDSRDLAEGHRMRDLPARYADAIDFQPEGHGIDRRDPRLIYVPEDTHLDPHEQLASGTWSNEPRHLKLPAGPYYVHDLRQDLDRVEALFRRSDADFEPLDRDDARDLVEDVLTHHYTEPMRRLIEAAAAEDGYFVYSAHPRIVDGKPSANPRYQQPRPDLADPLAGYIAEMGFRLHRRLSADVPIVHAVDAVLPRRRNNPPKPGIHPLAVYAPIHYQELPELFMDFIASLSGKSPSATGADSEGALTKGPFYALTYAADLNNALVSFILCGHDGFTTAAGHIGANRRVDHDISFLMPEIWCRLTPCERDARWLIEQGSLQRIADFEHEGRLLPASRLGYRITPRFMHAFLGKIFDDPMQVFDEAMLRPETQDLEAFVDGVEHIVDMHRRVAEGYLADASIDDACPPLRALLHIMAEGQYQGMDLAHPQIRRLFTREALLASDWYQERLTIKQQRDIARYQRHVRYLDGFLAEANSRCEPDRVARCEQARAELARVSAPAYLTSLWGGLDADGVHQPMALA